MKLYNYMENEVLKTIDKILNKRDDLCKCEKCKLDIAAIALNNLQPHYVVSEKGELYTKMKELELQFEVNIIKEVTNAINKVSKEPRHNF